MPSPTPTAAERTDAEQADILAENIDRRYGEDTQYTWIPAIVELTVDEGVAGVRTTLTGADADLAASMCGEIAAVAFTNLIEPIGITDVVISGADGADLANCAVPSR